MSKAVIVGSGHVGSCLALLLALEGVFDDIVLTDKRAARACAEADDMMAALPRLGASAHVRGGDASECADAQVVVITAAAPVKLGQTRNDMFAKNAAVVTDVVSEIEAAGFTGLYLSKRISAVHPTHLTTGLSLYQQETHDKTDY